MPKRFASCVLVFGFLAWGVALCSELRTPPTHPVLAGSVPPAGSMTTRERIASATWWPTSPSRDQAGYVGAQTCAKCHAEIVATQSRSQMAHTLAPAADSAVLREHLKQQYVAGAYRYTVGRTADHATVKVSDGADSRSADLQWAFGSGQVGQSYLWQEKDGSFREARFNYFSSINGFEATPGRLHGPPTSIDMALGRRVEGFEAKTCFGCHTTAMSSAAPLNTKSPDAKIPEATIPAASSLDTKSLVPGVTCEACHGPGAEHVAAMKSDAPAGTGHDLHIVNPGRMAPAQSVDFCGACHSTPWDVRLMGATGLQTVRFPAYRLEKSRCWGASGDARVTCKGCHDPHEPLERNPVAYDTACLGCHVTGRHAAINAQHPGAACPVATTKCVTCHMQKYELPEMHSKFTDHMIRVVRTGAAFPD